ncbi:MAG: hypothetical protein GY823_00005 [Flavobacteriaceae bacterium]|nr:hypothetical protein [Flavobacteriaceae bacterium]
MKNFFLFIILVGRYWAMGSSESNKTSRSRTGLSLTIMMYLMGILLNLMGLTDRPLKDVFNLSIETFMLIYFFILVSMMIGPVIYLKKQFTDEMLAEIVVLPDHDLKYNTPVNHVVSLFFVIGGFVCLFFLPKWLS